MNGVKPEWQLRREIVEVGKRIYDLGLVAASDGNISVRVSRDRFLVTPSGSCLGELQPQEILYVDSKRYVLAGQSRPGRVPRGSHGPTSELPMHLAAYEERPDVGAVVHAHPVTATGLTIAGLSLADPILPEVVLHLGSIPTAEYATLATEEGAQTIRGLIRNHDALILDRHGTLTVGVDLVCAFRNLEKVEHCARVFLTAHQLGRVRTLPPEEVAKLEALRQELGLGSQGEEQAARARVAPIR